MNIKQIIQEMVKDKFNFMPLYGTVKSVSTNTCVVSPLNGDPDILDVRLIANSGDGILVTPSVGSVVGVTMINNIEGFVSMYSQIDSIKYGDGSFDGFVKVGDLTSKLNSIENKLNDLITKFNSHVHTGVTTGGGSSGTTPTTETSISTTTQAEIENDKITHGNF